MGQSKRMKQQVLCGLPCCFVHTRLDQVYCNQESVDDSLVEILYRPSCDPGAIGVFVSVLTGA